MSRTLLPTTLLFLLAAGPVGPAHSGESASLYDFETHTLMGEETSLDQYRGKITLVVNVASKCGLTPQYEGLQKLQTEFGGDDFTILAFPSNDFKGQEPGSPEEIAAFCEKNYGVTFPMFEKVHVKGDEKCAIYQFLSADFEEPTWNFTKYLVGRDGKVLYRFDPKTTPEDATLRAKITEALEG